MAKLVLKIPEKLQGCHQKGINALHFDKYLNWGTQLTWHTYLVFVTSLTDVFRIHFSCIYLFIYTYQTGKETKINLLREILSSRTVLGASS